MNNDKFALLSGDEAASISGGSAQCWIATGAAILSLSLQSYNIYLISLTAMEFYC
jgi:hypothetical protein